MRQYPNNIYRYGAPAFESCYWSREAQRPACVTRTMIMIKLVEMEKGYIANGIVKCTMYEFLRENRHKPYSVRDRKVREAS